MIRGDSVMSRAQPKSSPTHQHARSIAAAIAKGRPPALTPDLDLYLESSPREIFVAFEGVARHMPPGGNDETLALGYLFLLHQSKIPASPERAKASARQHVDDREGGPLPDDVHAALAGFLEACGDDPFV